VKLYLYLSLASILFANHLQSVEEAKYIKFVDFPLTKVDYMYREQGGSIARLVFSLWDCTKEFLKNDFTQYQSDDTALQSVKDAYHKNAFPLFKKLNTFKRFIDELSYEWAEKRDREGIRELFKKMFSRFGSKEYVDSLPAEEFHQGLKDLHLFLWDVTQNAPYARAQCFESLNEKDYVLFEEFVKADYEEVA